MQHDQYKAREAKRQADYKREQTRRVNEIKQAEQEIKNLAVILKALPEDQEGARSLIITQMEALNKKLPKHKGRIWWHWLIEWCPKCQSSISQQPFAEDLGEDCALFQEIDKYNDFQRIGETEYKCSCGEPLMMKYRHAIADRTEEEKAEAWKYVEARS